MIPKRTLENWRRDALKYKDYAIAPNIEQVSAEVHMKDIHKLCDCILRLTQELLDQHLTRR